MVFVSEVCSALPLPSHSPGTTPALDLSSLALVCTHVLIRKGVLTSEPKKNISKRGSGPAQTDMCADRGWLLGTSVPGEKFTPLSPLSGVTYAAKGYFDALVKMGELASESQGSKELGKMPGGPESLDMHSGPGVLSCVWSFFGLGSGFSCPVREDFPK